jgi:Holliday junction resolvasome RuvABC DNA-binding subunit
MKISVNRETVRNMKKTTGANAKLNMKMMMDMNVNIDKDEMGHESHNECENECRDEDECETVNEMLSIRGYSGDQIKAAESGRNRQAVQMQ